MPHSVQECTKTPLDAKKAGVEILWFLAGTLMYALALNLFLIGNNIVNNAATTISAVLFIKLMGQERGPALSAIILTVVILIFGEITPKSLAKESPESWAMSSLPLLKFFLVVLTPLNFLFTQWKKLISLLFHSSDDNAITEE